MSNVTSMQRYWQPPDAMRNVNTLQLIEAAFTHRDVPRSFLGSEQLAAHEADDVMTFWRKPWWCVTGAQLETSFEAIFWFSPEAFCYYLPGIFSAGVHENNPWLIVNQSIVSMLDRSADPDSWDEFFCARWLRLTVKECEATQAWILWLSSFQDAYPEPALGRAFDTLELLKRKAPRSGAT
jgi:hypothetical protein